MNPTEILTTVKDSMTARRVYAEPIEREGVVVIPAARVSGGGGGGDGTQEDGRKGSGGGFAVSAKPVVRMSSGRAGSAGGPQSTSTG